MERILPNPGGKTGTARKRGEKRLQGLRGPQGRGFRSPVPDTLTASAKSGYTFSMANPLRKLPADEEPETAAWSADPFRYGSRWRPVRLPTGEVIDQEIPLTPEDLLDPQPGDEVTQSGPHAKILTLLNPLLDTRFKQ